MPGEAAEERGAQPETELRLVELLAALSLATDLGLGQPMEYLLRTCLLAVRLAEAVGLPGQDVAEVYYVALLRWIGCTSHAHELSVVFPDEIAARARVATADLADPGQVLLEALRYAGAGRPLPERLRALAAALAESPRSAVRRQLRASCEVAQLLAERLGFGPSLTAALRDGFERWDGRGFPEGRRGDTIPLATRVVQVAQDAELFHRLGGIAHATAMIRQRSGTLYDPRPAGSFCGQAASLLEGLDEGAVWERVVAGEPAPQRTVSGAELDAALEVVADYVDLKSPYTAGHSRGVAQLAAAAGAALGLDGAAVRRLRRGGLVHDLGRTGVPNGIWDKAGPLTETEWERVRLHPYYTERILARSAALRRLAEAAAHHERLDSSGYHRGAQGAALSLPARVLAAADAYQAMTAPRPHRAALAAHAAAAQLRAEVGTGRFHGPAVEAVLAAAGHRAGRRQVWPAGLTTREVEVLRLAARGLPNRETARRLSISERTAAHHIQHIYNKIGVATRGAAALFAIQHDLLDDEGAPGSM